MILDPFASARQPPDQEKPSDVEPGPSRDEQKDQAMKTGQDVEKDQAVKTRRNQGDKADRRQGRLGAKLLNACVRSDIGCHVHQDLSLFMALICHRGI